MTLSQMQTYVEILRSGDSAEREEASRKLRGMSAIDVSHLLETARQEKVGQEIASGCGGTLAFWLGITGVLLVCIGIVAISGAQWMTAALSGGIGLTMVAAAYAIHHEMWSNDAAWISEAIDHIEEPAAIGPLLTAVTVSQLPLRLHIIQAIMRLLPRVTRQEALEFSHFQRDSLSTIVTSDSGSFDTEFLEAVLGALPELGTEANLKAVRQLLARTPNSDRELQIQEAAKLCVFMLEARLTEERQAETLLRASNVESADALLRPAESVGPDERVMLRPAEFGGET